MNHIEEWLSDFERKSLIPEEQKDFVDLFKSYKNQ
jgi:hypothetical protein